MASNSRRLTLDVRISFTRRLDFQLMNAPSWQTIVAVDMTEGITFQLAT
jgi:hypothetical protein